MPSVVKPTVTQVRSWMDAIPPEKMYITMSAETLVRLGERKEDGTKDRLWNEYLAVNGIYAGKLKAVITGDLTSKAGARVRELEHLGTKVFTGSAALHLPKDAKVIYFTFEDRDEESLPVLLRQKVKAAFHKLQEGDFLSAVQLSLSSYLDQDLRGVQNLRQFIANQFSFNATQELDMLLESRVILSTSA